MNGWERFGGAFAPRSGVDMERGRLAGIQTEEAMLRARKARAEEVGRQQAAKEAMDAGESELANAILQGHGTLPGITTYREGRHKIGLTDEAAGLARDPSVPLSDINRRLMVIGGKPVDLTTIAGNVAFNPMLAPTEQRIAPTEIGQAMIGTEHAQQGAYGASANASNASAENSRAMALLHGAQMRGEVPGRGGSGRSANIPGGELALMFGERNDEGDLQTDPNEFRDFKRFQLEQGIADDEQAWLKWLESKQARESAAGELLGDMNGQIPEQLDVPAQPSLLDSFTAKIGMGPKKPGAPQKTAADAVSVASQEDFDKLAPGTMFINPADGRVMRKK